MRQSRSGIVPDVILEADQEVAPVIGETDAAQGRVKAQLPDQGIGQIPNLSGKEKTGEHASGWTSGWSRPPGGVALLPSAQFKTSLGWI